MARFWNNTGKRSLALFLALLMCVNLLSLTAFASEEDFLSGWKQDGQTVQGDNSDAVCAEEAGVLHLTAESDAGSYRGATTTNWPTVFVNDEVTQQLAGVGDGETAFVEMTFTPTSDASKSFGVFLNYENPGNGFVVCYDNQSGWYWQVCSTTGATEDYRGSGVKPTQGTATTLRLEWTDNSLKVIVDKATLFENVDTSPNTGTGFGIKCANGTDVTISSFQCGVVGGEEPVDPNPPAVEKPAAPVASDLYDQNGSIKLFCSDVFCGKEAEGQGYSGNHWRGLYAFKISEVQTNTEDNAAAYPYICKVTLPDTPQSYIDAFNSQEDNASVKHVLDETRSNSLEAVLYYSAANQRWELLADREPNNGLRHEGDWYYLTVRMDRYATYTWQTANGEQVQKVSLCKAVRDTVAAPAAYTKDGETYTFKEWTEGTDGLGNPTYTAQYNVTEPVNPPTPPESEYDGECGAEAGTVFYKLNGTELHIWGNGAMKDWNFTNNMPWSATRLTSIVIDEGVTTVGLNAFKMGNSSELVSVSLPEGLTKIGGSAFYHCYRLKEIAIPSTVTSIGSSAFYKCTGLGNVTLPAGLTELSDSAFNGCEGFTEITIPEGLTKIGESAFGGCKNVTNVSWGKVKEIGKSAFSGCGVTSVVLPETVTILNDYAFSSPSLVSIVIPDDVALRNQVFKSCYALQNVVLLGEPHLTYTEKVGYGESSNDVFRELYNTNPLFIYASGDAWMAKLAKMTTLGVQTYYIANLDGGVLDGTFETGKLATPTKEGYTFQGWYDGETALEKDGDVYTIPEGTTAGTTFTAKWGEEQQIPEHDGECGKVEGTVFYKITDGVLHIFGKGEMRDFEGVRSQPWNSKVNEITSVVIDEGVTSVGSQAFYEHKVTSIKLPSTLESVGNEAFRSCSALTAVAIPDGVTSLGSKAFYYSSALTSVRLPEGLTAINEGTFEQCTKLTSVNIPSTVKSIGNSAFFSCSSLRSIELPDGLESIGSNTFQRCHALTELVMPDTVTSCAPYAVDSCTSMTKIVLSAGLSGKDCPKLDGCTALETVILPAGINLPAYTFGAEKFTSYSTTCKSLRNIVAKGPLGKIDAKAFGGDNVWSWGIPLESTLIVYVANSTDANSMKTAMGKLAGEKYFIANLDGGTLTADVATGKLAPAEKDGFVFKGWKTATGASLKKEGDGYYGFLPNSAKGTVYIAQWEAEAPEVPAQPTNEQIAALNLYVDTWCVDDYLNSIGQTGSKPPKPTGCSCWTHAKVSEESHYTLGEVVANTAANSAEYPYICVLTLSDSFVQTRGAAIEGHTINAELTRSYTAILYYSEAGGWQIPDSTVDEVRSENGGKVITWNELNPNVRKESLLYMDILVENKAVCVWKDGEGNVLKSVNGSLCINPDLMADPEMRQSYVEVADNGSAVVYTYPSWTQTTEADGSLVRTVAYRATTVTVPEGKTVVWNEDAGTVTIPTGGVVVNENGKTKITVPQSLRSITVPTLRVEYLELSLTDVKNAGNVYKIDSKNVTSATLADGTVTTTVDRIGQSGDVYFAQGTTAEDEDHVCFAGTGAMGDYVSWNPSADRSPWNKNGYVDSVTIMDGVTHIGSYLFHNCPNLTKVEIAPSVETIGRNAFSKCGLTSVTIPEGVTSIGGSAFDGCASLSQVTLPQQSLTLIDHGAFQGTAITGMVIPEGVTEVGNSAFSGCKKLSSITLPDSLTTMGEGVFWNCTALTSVTIPASIESMGSIMFSGCTNLHSIVFEGVPAVVDAELFCNYNGRTEARSFIIYVMNDKDATALAGAIDKMPEGTEYYVANLNGHAFAEDAALAAKVLAAVSGTGVWVDGNGTELSSGAIPEGAANGTVYRFVNTYTVTVDGEEHTVKHGDKLSTVLPEKDPTKEGYTFQGWVDGETEVTAETEVTGGMTVTSKWELNSYTVTVDGEEHTVKHGDKLSTVLPTNPTRSGYTFQGWFDAEDKEVTADTVITGGMTITAKWTAIPYAATRYTLTIKYVDESGNAVASAYTRRLDSGSSYNVSSPAVEGMEPDQAVVSGRLTRNTTVTVTYTASTNIEEPDVPLAELPLPFEDVKDGDWYREAVAYVWSNDLMLGTGDKVFGVNANTTRGMMATILYRLDKEPGVAFEKVFSDVDSGKWFSQAVSWANANSVVLGYGNGMFGPDDNVTREQLVAMLYRYASMKGFDVSKRADLSKFADADKVSGYARDAMSWAVAEGLVVGRGSNRLVPDSTALRVEVATIFQRFTARYMTPETIA